MPYSESLAARMRPLLLPRAGVSERAMFGGIGFFLHGNMCCGIWKDLLVIRLSKEDAETSLMQPHVRMMDITGKPMKGWLLVEPEGYGDDRELLEWIERACAFVGTLPKK